MDGARLTYHQVAAAGEARDPLPEVYQPTISRGIRNVEAMMEPFDDEEPFLEHLYLAKAENPQQAYQLIGKPSKPLHHHAQGWGEVETAVLLPRSEQNGHEVAFRMPPPDQVTHVAIKKLNKAVVQHCLRAGIHENPYKEISRMQELGDNVHVLQCLEALEDEQFLYIVMPYSHEGSLLENLQMRGTPYTNAEARTLFRNILEILIHLEKHGIFHHDTSPDNFLFFNGRLLLFDFAMSIRVPREANGQRYLIRPERNIDGSRPCIYGTPPCQAPEIFSNQKPFDGIAGDLWAAGTILYYLLTGQVLYYRPHEGADILFRYYIYSGGLRPGLDGPIFDLLQEVYLNPDNSPQEGNALMDREMANQNIEPDAKEVLINILTFDPAARWTLIQTVESAWVQGN